MPLPQLFSPIRILPSQLADQIAAGEVIERPASVLKELIENALDAAAGRIDIELGAGGMEYLKVSDDGDGIPGAELPLAICRHATSKISRLDDLQALQSLGFRGEALASICSVSKWEISSRRRDQDDAHAMRFDTGEQLIAANHPVGTTVVVRKLFFNTPARRKFLRAERTEFRHCDEVFRRMALARFDVAFYLKHNDRLLQRLPVMSDDIGRSRRVGQLCGEAFLQQSLVIDYPHGGMRLWGWVSKPVYSRQQSDMQYFYINGRIIRDRVISHALRLAYQEYLPQGRHAAFVLHLELDPASVDVNVHPTKHEVRFHEARLVHDFIRRCLRDSLRQNRNLAVTAYGQLADSATEYSPSSYEGSIPPGPDTRMESAEAAYFGEYRSLLLEQFMISQSRTGWYLIDVLQAQAGLCRQDWQKACVNGSIKQQPLLIPQELALPSTRRADVELYLEELKLLGFDFTLSGPSRLLLRAVPVYMRGFDAAALLSVLLENDIVSRTMFDGIEKALLAQGFDIGTLDSKQFLSRLANRRDELTTCWRILEKDDLHKILLNRRPPND